MNKIHLEKETIIRGKKLRKPLSTKSFIRATLLDERYVVETDSSKKWYVEDTKLDTRIGIFEHELDAQRFADLQNSIDKSASTIGKLGGQSTSEAKKKAARENGKKGGRKKGLLNTKTLG